MRTVDPATSCLLLIDVQERLMPAVAGGAAALAKARKLLDAARLLGGPAMATE